MIKHPMILSTTEPNNSIGVIKVRQGDDETQTFVVTVTEQSQRKDFTGYEVFFCIRTGTTKGIVENKVITSGETIAKTGEFNYTLTPYDWQRVGVTTAYFDFRKLDSQLNILKRFSTRDFSYTVTPNAFSDGIKDSNYVWTFEDLLRLFQEFMDSGQSDFWVWFESIKDTLGEDAAGALAIKIEAIFANINEINDRLNPIVENNLNLENMSNFSLFAFFRSNTDQVVDLHLTEDGGSFKRAFRIDVQDNVRDPSLVFFKGYFYIAYTHYNPHDFGILKSKDLINWETFKVSAGLFNIEVNNRIWAPEFFIDEDKLYVTVSVRQHNDVDIDGNVIPYFDSYIVDATDIENNNFGEPRKLVLEEKNKIDPHISRVGDKYLLVIKDEFDKRIELWESKNLVDWVKKSDFIEELGDYVEGPFIVKNKNGYAIYVDAFKERQSYYSVTTDFSTFTRRYPTEIKDEHRHGSGINILDEKAKKIYTDFCSVYVNTKQKSTGRTVSLLDYVNGNNEIEVFEPIENYIYNVGNLSDINILNTTNSNGAKIFYVALRTNAVGRIKFQNNGDIEVGSQGFEISVRYGNNDTLIPFVWMEFLRKFKPIMPNPVNLLSRKFTNITDYRNGATNAGGTPPVAVGVFGNEIKLRGLIKLGTVTTANTVLFNNPNSEVWPREKTKQICLGASGGRSTFIECHPNGDVILAGGTMQVGDTIDISNVCYTI